MKRTKWIHKLPVSTARGLSNNWREAYRTMKPTLQSCMANYRPHQGGIPSSAFFGVLPEIGTTDRT
jgi:hypothetical protein